jgi:hypothetical protein
LILLRTEGAAVSAQNIMTAIRSMGFGFFLLTFRFPLFQARFPNCQRPFGRTGSFQVMKVNKIRAFMRFGKSCWKRSLARTRVFFSPLSIPTFKSLSAARKASRPFEKFGSRKMSIVRSGTRWLSCSGSAGRSENQRTNFGRRMFSAGSRTTTEASIFQQSSPKT